MTRQSLCWGVVATALLGAAPAFGDATFTVESPTTPPKTGQLVKFTATPPAPGYSSGYSWDLNGDGIYGDKTGSPVTWSYSAPGPVTVGLWAPDATNQGSKVLQIDGPSAEFVSFPASPLVGEAVTFVYSSTQATPPDAPPEWDLNGDGQYGDATGPTATRTFPAPGPYLVGLKVTDLDGAVSTSTKLLTVRAPTPVTKGSNPPRLRLMSPFPVVRITGKVSKKGALIKRLTIRAPYGSTVMVRCRGGGCPFRRTSQTLARAGAKAPSKTIRVKRLERRLLRGGATVKILVSGQGEIGKYTRFKIRTGKPPLRTDLCLTPGSTAPKECPSS